MGLVDPHTPHTSCQKVSSGRVVVSQLSRGIHIFVAVSQPFHPTHTSDVVIRGRSDQHFLWVSVRLGSVPSMVKRQRKFKTPPRLKGTYRRSEHAFSSEPARACSSPLVLEQRCTLFRNKRFLQPPRGPCSSHGCGSTGAGSDNWQSFFSALQRRARFSPP